VVSVSGPGHAVKVGGGGTTCINMGGHVTQRIFATDRKQNTTSHQASSTFITKPWEIRHILLLTACRIPSHTLHLHLSSKNHGKYGAFSSYRKQNTTSHYASSPFITKPWEILHNLLLQHAEYHLISSLTLSAQSLIGKKIPPHIILILFHSSSCYYSRTDRKRNTTSRQALPQFSCAHNPSDLKFYHAS
jgi:hypothetical protein